jgi:4-hydroxybenzoate polyprenyltransferase
MNLLALLRALRPHQWVKNVFVFAAVVFAYGEVGRVHPEDHSDVVHTFQAFFAFCLGASAIYLVNDVLDRESDRAHPTKRERPIARGDVTVPVALVTSAILVAGALFLGWLAGGESAKVAYVVAGYIALNFAYSVKLKHLVLIDAFCIATGFLLRILAGGLAADAKVSHWLLLCTLFLALFLALCKRRAEIELLGDGRGAHRANLRQYTVPFLDQLVTVLAATTIVNYTMYTVADETVHKFESTNLVWSVPFVVFGIARYMFLVQTSRAGGNPTRVLLGGDAMFAVNAVLWFAVVAGVLFARTSGA